MKLLMENWRKYLTEEEKPAKLNLTESIVREFITEFYETESSGLSEEQILEALPKWIQKRAAAAGLIGALLGAPGGDAMAHPGHGGHPESNPPAQHDHPQEWEREQDNAWDRDYFLNVFSPAADRLSAAGADYEQYKTEMKPLADAGGGVFSTWLYNLDLANLAYCEVGAEQAREHIEVAYSNNVFGDPGTVDRHNGDWSGVKCDAARP